MYQVRKNNRGFSLVELMVAIVVSTILIAAVSATYIAQNRSYVAQENVTEINTQAKIAIDVMANDIKTAGFGVPADMNQDAVNGLTTVVSFIDNSDAPDAITVVGGFRMLGTLWPALGAPSTISCAAQGAYVPLGSTTVRIDYVDSADIFNTDDKRSISIDGINYATVANVSDTDATITLDRPLSQDFPLLDTDGDGNCDTGRPVYVVEDTTFCVDGNGVLHRIRRRADMTTCTPSVTSDDDVLAENIEDLQFAYAVDTDGDGQIDDLNGDGLIDDQDYLISGNGVDPVTIRAVRINVLARAEREDVNYQGMGNPPSLIENRNHAATNDNFRRRWWQTVVTIRNQ